MGILKSLARDEIVSILVVETLADAYAYLRVCYPSANFSKDYQKDSDYIRSRFEAEGIAFFTIALPRLGEFIDELVRGRDVQRVVGFKPYNGLYCAFLRPFWPLLARMGNTREWSSDDIQVYRALRTLCHGLKKLEVPCSADLAKARLDSFLEIESDMADFEVVPSPHIWRAQHLAEDLLRFYEVECNRPKHGPGAVAGGEHHNQKWEWSCLYDTVHQEFPYYEYLYPVRSQTQGNPSRVSRPLQLLHSIKAYKSLKRIKSPTARMLAVPKDSRGPRLISCEPKELMYLQQGVAEHLVDFLETHPYTRGHVNFRDQSINASLALSSSRSKSHDTIDLSDASDRVSVELVKYLFPFRVTRKWLALRSTATILPDGRSTPLRKFAPMGSALCFPVEALCFWCLAVGAIWESTGNLDLALDSVYVYGDDIIVATGYTSLVTHVLEACFLKVNKSKSFVGDDPFRESCGVDAFNGEDVSIQRVRSLPPMRSSDGAAITAWLKYAENTQLLLPRRSRLCLDVVERLVGAIPRVPFEQPFLSIVTPSDHWSVEDYDHPQWDAAACYWKARVLLLKQKKRYSAIPEWARLQRNLIQRSLQGSPEEVVDRSSTQIRRGHASVTYLGAV